MEDNFSSSLASLVLPRPEDFDKIFKGFQTSEIQSLTQQIREAFNSNQMNFTLAKSPMEELANQIKANKLTSNPFKGIQDQIVSKLKNGKITTVPISQSIIDLQDNLSSISNRLSFIRLNDTLKKINLSQIDNNENFDKLYEENQKVAESILNDIASEDIDDLVKSGEISEKAISIFEKNLPENLNKSKIEFFWNLFVTILFFIASTYIAIHLSDASTNTIVNEINSSQEKTENLVEKSTIDNQSLIKEQNVRLDSIKEENINLNESQDQLKNDINEIDEKVDNVYDVIEKLLLDKYQEREDL